MKLLRVVTHLSSLSFAVTATHKNVKKSPSDRAGPRRFTAAVEEVLLVVIFLFRRTRHRQVSPAPPSASVVVPLVFNLGDGGEREGA